MTHKNIKRFQIRGEFLSDAEIPLTRIKYETLLRHSMRTDGFVPILDLDTAWSTQYSESENRWFFLLTIQGVYVGRKRAKVCEGISSGVPVPRSTRKVT